MSLNAYGVAVELCFAVNVLASGWVLLHDGNRQVAVTQAAGSLTTILSRESEALPWVVWAVWLGQVFRQVALWSGAVFATAIYIGINSIPNESLPGGLPFGAGNYLELFWPVIKWCAVYLSPVSVIAMQAMSGLLSLVDKALMALIQLVARLTKEEPESQRDRIKKHIADTKKPPETAPESN